MGESRGRVLAFVHAVPGRGIPCDGWLSISPKTPEKRSFLHQQEALATLESLRPGSFADRMRQVSEEQTGSRIRF